jgi:DNA-binding response OmpR family regulator
MSETLTKPLRILVVDDDPACRKLLQRTIEKSSVETCLVETAESMEQTLEILSTNQFDIILLDLNLPGSYGLATIASVIDAQTTAAIVIVSGLDGQDETIQQASNDVHGCLTKGEYNIEILEKTLIEAFERKNAPK